MKASAGQLAQSLYEAVKKNPSKKRSTVKRFLDVLTRLKQKRLLPLVIRSLDEVEQKATRTTTVIVEAPFKLSTEKLNNLLRLIQKKYKLQRLTAKIILEPELIGGVRVKFNDVVIDASAKSRLNQLNHGISKVDL